MKIRLEYIQEDSKSFGLELNAFSLNRFFKQSYTTLSYALHYITKHYVQLSHHTKRKGVVMENVAMPQSFLREI